MNALLTKILNLILDKNKSSKEQLKKFANMSFSLNFLGLGLACTIMEDGSLTANSDLKIINSTIIIPTASLSYLISKDELALLRHIKITGETNFALSLLKIFSKMNLNEVYAMVSPLNGMVLQQIESLFKMLKDYLLLVNNNMQYSLSEYLVYETRTIVNKFKLESFCNEVDEIKARTDILMKKIERLLNK